MPGLMAVICENEWMSTILRKHSCKPMRCVIDRLVFGFVPVCTLQVRIS